MRKATTLFMVLASLFFYTVILAGAASADPDAPGNNGTVKIVNDQGDGTDDSDNDPHVCLFHLYGFHFDDSSKGTWHIEVWAPGGGPLTATQQDGTWTADGTGKFDAHPAAQPFPDGHYKLFVKETFDPKSAKATPGGNKQKVFWVKCAQANGTGESTGTSTGTSTGASTGSSTGSTTGSSTGTTTGTTTGTNNNATNSTAVAGFQTPPSNNAVGAVSPIVEAPQANAAVAGTQTGGTVAGVQSLPSTSTSSAPALPLAGIGLALMAMGGALLRRRDIQA